MLRLEGRREKFYSGAAPEPNIWAPPTMQPLVPRLHLIVDTWGFRLVDPDGNLIGKQQGIEIKDGIGNVIRIDPPPGIERLVRALPLDR
jgi:hypothetical protein